VSELRRFQNARRNDKKKYRTDIEAMLHAFLTSSTSSSMENSPLPIGQKKNLLRHTAHLKVMLTGTRQAV